jgi:cytochrome c553
MKHVFPAAPVFLTAAVIAAPEIAGPARQPAHRQGTWSTLMKPVVARLSEHDTIALAAYAASLAP